jgi:hypothetical protein
MKILKWLSTKMREARGIKTEQPNTEYEKVEQNRIEKEKVMQKKRFYALTPIEDKDIGVYKDAFNFVFSNDKVLNVAVSGSYGAGKSSILESYEKLCKDKKFIHISLAHFASQYDNFSSDNIGLSMEAKLEGKILNQLIHKIPSRKIPLTSFRVKRDTPKVFSVFTAILSLIVVLLGLYFTLFERWSKMIDSLTVSFFADFLAFTKKTESRLIAGIFIIIFISMLIYIFNKMYGNHYLIKKAQVNGVEIEIFEECNESYFDKYLNEVLYLFEKTDADVIVFEDIDRYDMSSIFERLREINTLINCAHKRKPLRFFYLLRDDIFVSKDRTKFFDFIIPIIPVIDGTNAYDKFYDCFKDNGLIGSNKIGSNTIDVEFLQGLSLYIDDMRILKNISNEFLIYIEQLTEIEPDPNKMLAIIAYKNLFPRDFADLQLGRGFVNTLFTQKEKIVDETKQQESIHKQLNFPTGYLETKPEYIRLGRLSTR